MTITVNGNVVELNGKVKVKNYDASGLGYTESFISVSFKETALSYTVKNSKTNEELIHEFGNIEGVTEYENAVYIYAHHSYSGNKCQLVFYKNISK